MSIKAIAPTTGVTGASPNRNQAQNTENSAAMIEASEMMRGETYFNVHSDSHPAGEIRGQVIPPGIEIYLATPKGIEEVPQPVASSEFARAAITLDTRANVAQVHFTTTADLAAAHIHQGIAGTNGQVAIEMQQDANSAGH